MHRNEYNNVVENEKFTDAEMYNLSYRALNILLDYKQSSNYVTCFKLECISYYHWKNVLVPWNPETFRYLARVFYKSINSLYWIFHSRNENLRCQCSIHAFSLIYLWNFIAIEWLKYIAPVQIIEIHFTLEFCWRHNVIKLWHAFDNNILRF